MNLGDSLDTFPAAINPLYPFFHCRSRLPEGYCAQPVAQSDGPPRIERPR